MTAIRPFALVLLSCALGFAAPGAAREAPEAPAMPEGWVVVSDESFSPDEINPVARRLGGDIEALRNTVYEVHAKRVQLNLVIAADEASAAQIFESLKRTKPAEFLLRRDLTIYELVGKNDAIPEMRAARAHLERSEDVH